MGVGDPVGNTVAFSINGVQYSINERTKNVTGRTMLVDYVRDVANLKGTKVMCREGGCGACLVNAKVIDPKTGNEITKSVNSCLTPVLSCNGWDISTIERLGNKQEGYHVVQNRLVNFHGTQCGFCTPGMVMNMYSLLESNKDIKMEDVEKNFDGNICRCTGYRPIMDAFKSLAVDASDDLQKKCGDIEDCITCPLKKQGSVCTKSLSVLSTPAVVKLLSGEKWVTATTLEAALSAANTEKESRFVAGNTSTGIFKNEGPFQTFIDVNGIPELRERKVTQDGITIGGGVTLTELINLLKENKSNPGMEYAARVASHLERVANISVRNNGTVAGNLMIKHNHNEFPSDVFVILEAVGATITLAEFVNQTVKLTKPTSPMQFLAINMTRKLLHSIQLPQRQGYHYRSFKITRRYQNAHAYVNAALLFKVEKSKDGQSVTVKEQPRIVYGGISKTFVHASSAEACLVGKNLLDKKTLTEPFQALHGQIQKEISEETGLESSKEYRLQLVKSLLYKTILEIVSSVPGHIRSGASDLARKLTTSKQTIDTDTTATALYKAVPKYEGGIQASGEAEYTGDIPHRPDELFAAYVMSTEGNADILEVDPSPALAIKGVFRFITAKDIPGENNAMKFHVFPNMTPEPVFAVDKVTFHGEALGLILASTQEAAQKAAKLVKVKYGNIKKPVVCIDEAIKISKEDGSFENRVAGKFTTKPVPGLSTVHKLSGTVQCGWQYHFYMETQSVVCHPREDGLDVYSSTQWLDHVQNGIASALQIPSNAVNVQVRRIGGGFGGKGTRPTTIAIACAVAAWATQRPVRLILDLETNLRMVGKRNPFRMPYQVGFDDQGRISSLNVDLICDAGIIPNEATSPFAAAHLQNVYKAAGWEVACRVMTTNTPANTTCRAPGSVQSVAAIEWVMDHIASYLNLDPMKVREVNLLQTGDSLITSEVYDRVNLIPEMIELMKSPEGGEYEARKAAVEKFNLENRWNKRGLGIVPVRYPIGFWATNLPASVAVYHMDGQIAVSHGGIEMGQGLNTKVIQTVAQSLQVPMKYIKIKPTNNFIAANAFPTGGSIASELVCYAVMRACEEIKQNLQPILEKMENPSWEKLVAEAYQAKACLTATYTPKVEDDIKGYDVWVLNLTEAEIDVLTGEYKIVRTDLYEDTGKSLSPAIDLGQIEGGYVMAQGVWTTEKIVYDNQTGELLTKGTWDYKVPQCKDIPEDFRITLLSNAPNPHGILRSKATGEPSTDSGYAVVLAIRKAIASARKDAGNEDWFEMDSPVTPEDVARLCLTNESHFKLD